MQWLKIAKGAAEKLLTLSTDDEPGEVAPPPRVARGEAVLRAVACLRRVVRQEIQKGGREEIGKLVEQVVLACVGEIPANRLDETPAQVGAAVAGEPVASALDGPGSKASYWSICNGFAVPIANCETGSANCKMGRRSQPARTVASSATGIIEKAGIVG
ncbi:MAG: hypothetical protein L0211_17605 [Planctomycetaceae bacterium]|nr:hypothetical protein [Planctomycetaceae bacterium]